MTKICAAALLLVPSDWTDLTSVKARFPAQLAPLLVADLLAALEVQKRIESRSFGDPPRAQVRLVPGKTPA